MPSSTGSAGTASTAPRTSSCPAAARSCVGRDLAEINQIVLHLGNGCSASAVRGGVAVEASMGLTPLQGLVMGTRSGDVDPGLHTFLHNELGMSVGDIDTMLNKQSGLKGMAGVNDFRELEQRRAAGDETARLAFDVYVHRLKHYVGAYLAILGRVDVLTFTAGVGENNPALRASVAEGLDGLGIAVDAELNNASSKSARVISPDGSNTRVAVIPDQRGTGHRPRGGNPAGGWRRLLIREASSESRGEMSSPDA